MRKLLSLILSVLLTVALCTSVSAAEEAKSNDIVILYTNDVHAYIDGPLSYDTIGAIKKQLEKEYRYVLLVDAGDHLQGTAFGATDQGASIIQLMNTVGYDLAVPGNHEFDYGMDTFLTRTKEANFPYISCNFYEISSGIRGKNVLDSFGAYHFGKEIVAIVGISTPETIVKSTPAFFQDETGNYCYGISGGDDGSALYADVQSAIDAVRKAGATKVIALGHLGDDASSSPWTSEEVIAHVSGMDAFIDGHSHSTIPGKSVMCADGTGVHLTQTGEYLNHLGIMIIDYETGEIRSDLISCDEIVDTVKNRDGTETTKVSGYRLSSDLYSGPDWVQDYVYSAKKNAWIKKVNLTLKQKIGQSDIIFDNYSEDGIRLVRKQETNTGDFAADALYYLFDSMDLDVDAAVVNGGGIRNKAISGTLTYKTCKDIHTFGNVACLQTVTGQQLLDALEWGSRTAGSEEECGGFLQVAGVHYQIDTDWPESTQKDDMGMWIGAPTGGYRVHDVELYNKESNTWEPLDLERKYNLAGYNYILRNRGDGYNMFSTAVNVVDYVMEDYQVLGNYIRAFDNQKITADNSPLLVKYPDFGIDYSNVNGSGRILYAKADHIKDVSADITEPPETITIIETSPAEENSLSVNETPHFPIIPLAIAVFSGAILIIMLIFRKKYNKGRHTE